MCRLVKPVLFLILALNCLPASGQLESAPPGPSRAADASYRLSPRDIIIVKVYREEDLTTEARIDKNGTITFPLIGNIRLIGLTPQEAAQKIAQALKGDYLIDPQVSVGVAEYSVRRITILGQVARPGTFEMPDDSSVNLLEAIGMAGGFTRIARPNHITLKRTVDGKERTYKLDAKSMAKDASTEPFEIFPGDTITVAESLF